MICARCGADVPEGMADAGCPACCFGSALNVGAPGSALPRGVGFAGYELLHELGRGAMGVVWLARETALDRLVALKVISAPDERLRQRLLREGQAAARLRHPHIVPILAFGGTGSGTYLAMEFLEGGNLDEHLDRKPLPPRRAAELVAKLAGALAAAHDAGVLHRDLKPSNILLDAAGEPFLADFGLAAPTQGAGDLTLAGHVAGTPAYLAPELLQGADRASRASDLYGLGAVLYAALTGQPPFRGDSAASILAQLPETEPLSPRALHPSVPRDLETICLKCLQKSPGARYPSATQLQSDLQRFLRGEPISARPVSRAEKAWRWARRRPAAAISASVAALLLLILAIGGPLVALRLRLRLREALLAHSQALVLTVSDGQRFDALAAAEEAGRLGRGLDVRNAVIAALSRSDIVKVREWHARKGTRYALVFDPDNDRYAVQDQPGHLEVRRLSDASLISAFSRGAADTYAPAFSPDGHLLVALNQVGEALVWREGQTSPMVVLPGRTVAVSSTGYALPAAAAFSPDGRVLASGLAQSGVDLVEISSRRTLRHIETPARVSYVRFSPQGDRLAVGSGSTGDGPRGGFFTVFDPTTGTVVSRLATSRLFEDAQWSADGRRIAVGSNPVGIFRAADGARLFTIPAPNIRSVWFGPRTNHILISTYYGELTVFDLASGTALLGTGLGGQYEFAASRDGTLIAKSSGPEDARLFRLQPSDIVRTVATEADQTEDVSNNGGILEYSRDGEFIATAARGRVELRSAASGNVLAVCRWGKATSVDTVRFAPDGKSLIACSDERGLVRMLIVKAGAEPRLELGAPIDPEPGYQLQMLSRDGRLALLTWSVKGRVKIVATDGAQPTVRWNLEGATRGTFLPGDREALVNSVVGIGHVPLELHDVSTGKLTRVLPLMRGQHVHASADGRWLMVGAGINSTVLLRCDTLKPGPALPARTQGAGHNAAFSADGALIVLGIGARAILVRTADGAELAELQNPEKGKGMAELAFAPDGSRVAVLHRSGQLAIWDLRRTRQELAARGLDW